MYRLSIYHPIHIIFDIDTKDEAEMLWGRYYGPLFRKLIELTNVSTTYERGPLHYTLNVSEIEVTDCDVKEYKTIIMEMASVDDRNGR